MPSPAARAYAEHSRRAAPYAPRPSPLGRPLVARSRQPLKGSHTDHQVYLSRTPEARTDSGVSCAKLLLAANAYVRSDGNGDEEATTADFQLDFSSELVAISSALFDDGASSDVTLRTPSGREYRLHRSILAGWSRTFKDKLSDVDLAGVVSAPFEAEPAALESMLRSLYTGWVDLDCDTAVPLLAVFSAYGISAPAAACKHFLDANTDREQWGTQLRYQLRAMRGAGSMDEMWRRAEELIHRLPDTPVARKAQISMQTQRMRVNLSAELLHVLASLFGAHNPGSFSDATLVLQREEFFVHRGILCGWSDVLRKKFEQQREHDPAAIHGYSARVTDRCRVNLAFEFECTAGNEIEQAETTVTADAIQQLLRVFYTGQLLLANELNTHRMLQAAVAFGVPTVELACRTWLMARLGNQSLTLPKLKERQVSFAESNDQLVDTTRQGHGSRKVPRPPSKQAAELMAPELDPLDRIYDRLNHSGYGLSLLEVDHAMEALAPALVGHKSGTVDLEVTLVGSSARGHGIILDPLRGPPFTVAEITPDSLASRVRPPIQPGMQLLAVNATSVKAEPDHNTVRAVLKRESAGKGPIILTMRSNKIREVDRAKVLHLAFNAADLGGDGWITRRQFSRMGQYLQYVHAKYQQVQQVLDKLGRLLTYDDFKTACAMMKERSTQQDFEKLRILAARSSVDSTGTYIEATQAAETTMTFSDDFLGITFVENSAWASGAGTHSTCIESISANVTTPPKGKCQVSVGDFVISVDGISVAHEHYYDVVRRIDDSKRPVVVGFGSKSAIAAQTIETHMFLSWIIRRSAMGTRNKMQTTHLFEFNKPGSLPFALSCVRDMDRGVDTAVVKCVTQDSEVEVLPGLRSGMVLTSIYSPALSKTKRIAARFKSWALGHKNSPTKMSQGAHKRIKERKKAELDCLEEALRKSMVAATGGKDGLQRNEGGFLGWDALCLLGVDAVHNLLKLLFCSNDALPITLGFAVGTHKVWYPGEARCDASFSKSQGQRDFISLSEVDNSVRHLFGSFDVEITHRSVVRAYNAADDHGDGCISKRSFRRLVQYLVYFHNNASLLDAAESIVYAHSESMTLAEFIQCCEIMSEQLTDEEAISEFTGRQMNSSGDFSFNEFCTWIVKRAAFRMQMELAEPQTVHAVSHASVQPRGGRLVMAPRAILKSVFQQHCSITSSCERMPESAVLDAVSTVFVEAPKKRQGQLVPCALKALKEDLNTRDGPRDGLEFSDFVKLLRYNIILDDLWDKVSQCVHHQIQPRTATSTGCCSTPRSKITGKLDHVMLHTDFVVACQLAAVEIPENELHSAFEHLERMSPDGHVRLREFCSWMVRQRHSAGQGQSLLSDRKNPNRLLQLKIVIFAIQHDQVDHAHAMKKASELVDDSGLNTTLVNAALEAAQGTRRSVLRSHEILAFLEYIVFLNGICGPVFKAFGTANRHLHLGDFRRCCDLVELQIAEAEIAHEFRHMGSLMGKLNDAGLLADGHVDLKDFLVWFARREGPSWASWMQIPPQTRIDSVFQRYAGEGDFLSPLEVRQAVKELFPGFENDELMTMASQAIHTPYSNTSSGGFLDKEIFSVLLRLTLCLAKLWDGISFRGPIILESTFHKACLTVDLVVSPTEAARHFVQLDTFNDGHITFKEFCIWAIRCAVYLSHNDDANPQEFFDRHERDGTISLVRISEAIEKFADYDTSFHHVIVLAHKAAGIHGIAQINREQFSNMFLYLKEFRLMESLMRRIYDTHGEGAAIDSSAWDLSRRLSVERLLEDKQSGVNEHQDDTFISLQFKANGRNYIKFGDYCSWLVQRRMNKFSYKRAMVGVFGSSLDSLLDTLSSKALYRLGIQYQRGERVPKNAGSAAQCFHNAANRGFAEAQRTYGECLAAGDGVTQDLQQAAVFYQLAADQGDCIARSHLGVSYLNGLGVQKDPEAAVDCFRGASNDPIAQFNLGFCLFNGLGVAQNSVEAAKQYKKAAKHGLPEAQCNLGECLMHGTGIGKDPAKAVELYMQAAKQGLAAALFNLGMCFLHGHGVEPDEAESARYFTQAANQRHPRAAAKLAKVDEQTHIEHADAQYQHGMFLYEQWRSSGDLPTLTDAIRCFSHASSLQHRGSHYMLAKLLSKGEGMDIDEREACKYAKLAADAHDIEAANLLGDLLLARWARDSEGSDSSQTLDEAIYYLTLAAEGGANRAQFSLGQIYVAQGYDISSGNILNFASSNRWQLDPNSKSEPTNDTSWQYMSSARHASHETGYHTVNLDRLLVIAGNHTVCDEEALATAAQWLAKSAHGDSIPAMLTLGALYLRGHGVHQSDVEATGWYRQAAECGDASGQYSVGWLILKGTGTCRDFLRARDMFQASAQQGNTEAMAVLRKWDLLESCARQSGGNFSLFLDRLHAVDENLCARAEWYASAQVVAQPLKEYLQVDVPEALELEIQKHVREHAALSEENEKISKTRGTLDAQRLSIPEAHVPHTRLVIVSSRHAALRMLLDAAHTSVKVVISSEIDTLDSILARVRQQVRERTLHSIGLVVVAHNDCLPLLQTQPISSATLSSTTVASFWKDLCDCAEDRIDILRCNPGKKYVPLDSELSAQLQHLGSAVKIEIMNMLSDVIDDYFVNSKVEEWCTVASEHEAVRSNQVEQAQKRAREVEREVQRTQELYAAEQRARSGELDARRQQRGEHMQSIGVSTAVQLQLQPELAVAPIKVEMDAAEDTLFQRGLLESTRRKSQNIADGLAALPWIIELCVQRIERALDYDDHRGCNFIEIFKVPQNIAVFDDLQQKLNYGGDNLQLRDIAEVDVLDVAFVIIKWLAELPEPLLCPAAAPGGKSLYERFQEVDVYSGVSASLNGEASAVEQLRELVNELPAANVAILKFMLKLVRKIVKSVESVDADRISLAVTPAILRNAKSHQPGTNQEIPRLNYRAVALMAKHFDWVFGSPEIEPGQYRVTGEIASSSYRGRTATGYLWLAHDQRVEGLVAVSLPVSSSPSVATLSTVQHIISGDWQWNGNVNFRTRGPRHQQLRITVKEVAGLESHHNVGKVFVDVSSPEIQCRTPSEVIYGGKAQWQDNCGLIAFSANLPSELTVRCISEQGDKEIVLGEDIIGLDKSGTMPWVREMFVPVSVQLGTDVKIATILLLVEWDPSHEHQYALRINKNELSERQTQSGIGTWTTLSESEAEQEGTIQLKLSRLAGTCRFARVYAEGGAAGQGLGMTMSDRRHGSQRICYVSKLHYSDGGLKGRAEAAGIPTGVRILQINGQQINSVAQAERILKQSLDRSEPDAFVDLLFEEMPQSRSRRRILMNCCSAGNHRD